MNIEQLESVIARNAILDPNDNIGQEECWNQMTAILSSNIEETLRYFQGECTDEAFYWLSAVFEDVAEKTQSREFIKVLRDRLSGISQECYCQDHFSSEHMKTLVDYTEYVRSISVDIDSAESRLRD